MVRLNGNGECVAEAGRSVGRSVDVRGRSVVSERSYGIALGSTGRCGGWWVIGGCYGMDADDCYR